MAVPIVYLPGASHGDADPICPPAVMRRLAELIPGASMRAIAGGTHALAAERPEEVAGAIREHLTCERVTLRARLLAEAEVIPGRPSLQELVQRIHGRSSPARTDLCSADLIRAEREERERALTQRHEP